VFFYERWDVFKALVRLRDVARELSKYRTPRTASDLEQLRRASSSAILNLSEEARERQFGKKLERYNTSRGSVSECNGALIILAGDLPRGAHALIEEGRDVADRSSAMLTNLIRNTERRAKE